MTEKMGDRFKSCEEISSLKLTSKIPVIIRSDGKGFSGFTRRNFKKPFDSTFTDAMLYAANKTSKEISGFKLAYLQSDEVSFLLSDLDTTTTQGWFDYKVQKLVSVSAAMMTAYFYDYLNSYADKTIVDVPVFDSRAFNVPLEDTANYFLWRSKAAARNSLSMYCSQYFSHKQLDEKSIEQRHEMLEQSGHLPWGDLANKFKCGTIITKDRLYSNFLYTPTYENWQTLIDYSLSPTVDTV